MYVPSVFASEDKINTSINSSNTNDSDFLHTIPFEDVLDEKKIEEPIPYPLINEKASLEKSMPKTSFEIAHLSATFYHYGLDYLATKSDAPKSLEKCEFSINSMHILVTNYGSNDALGGLEDFWEQIENTSSLIEKILDCFKELLQAKELPLKGINNRISIEGGKHKITNTLKDQLHKFAMSLTDMFKKDKLMAVFEEKIKEEGVEEEIEDLIDIPELKEIL